MKGRVRVTAGQASVDLLAVVPALLVLAMAVFQLLAVGYAQVLAGDAAEAGALALAGGGDAAGAVRRALPGWSRAHLKVEVRGGGVQVRLRPPSPIEAVARRLEVDATAAVELR